MKIPVLYTEKALHVGFPYMLGRIIIAEFHEEYFLVTVRYEPTILNPVIPDKIFKVMKVVKIPERMF
jgi:hypothetical protein